MKRKVTTAFLFANALALASTAAFSWEGNPTENRYRQGSGLGVIPFEPLHEIVTWNALDCALASDLPRSAVGLKSCPPLNFGRRAPEPGNFDSALIRGVWWNDDPNQLLNAVHYPTWLAYMSDAKRRSKTPGGINSTYKLQYRSHYGDLQFLHAMAEADGEAAADTRDKLMAWFDFAYSVAVRKTAQEAKLGEIEMVVMQRFFQNQSGWTVSYLFNPKYVLRGDSLPDHALGSMLHVIQDSFAAGHVARSRTATQECPLGTIRQFHAYQSEDDKKHAAADTREALVQADPNLVPIVARMIELQRNGADWSTKVRPFLEHVFCLDPAVEPAGPGEFA